MNIQRCPYDATPIEAMGYSGGSFLLTCSACGAEWEAHNTLVRRVTPPDWDAVRASREGAVTSTTPPPPS
ncbi:MAG: hypothetical protein FJW88_04485 [Actinobacteria bacterium]|nr:hypothetical protein [Actinomycetota bacterium]